jgi:Uma2 family endonuclease
MTLAAPSLTLAEFLQLPETKPASEYIAGAIMLKPMPKPKHNRLQLKLCEAINGVTEPAQIAYAFPELRCTFGGRSTVPDIAVLRWAQIELDAAGEPIDDVLTAPVWTIEILSPDQSANRVTGNILHCLRHGSQMGWLLDAVDRSILVLRPDQPPELFIGSDIVPVPSMIALRLTTDQVFSWLRMQP